MGKKRGLLGAIGYALMMRDPEWTGNLQDPNVPLTPSILWGAERASKFINPTLAMQISAVNACVKVLAESVASLSLITYKTLEGGGKERYREHPNYRLLHTRPNPYLSSYNWREQLMKDVLLEGNHYCEIEFSRSDGYVRALWPLVARNMTMKVKPRPHYIYQTDQGPKELAYEQVLHITGMGDGYIGESVLHYGARTMSLSLVQEEFTDNFFGNGSAMQGVLVSKKPLSEVARKRMEAGWKASHTGAGNMRDIAILEDDVDWKATGINPEDAQVMSLRKFSIPEIARFFHVPLHMISELERATFSNIEHLGIEFVVYTLRPWLIRIEQAINHKLFDPNEQEDIFSEFLVDSLLRGDVLARSQALHLQRQDGIINADEWREIENKNPQPNGQGKVYLVNSTMTGGKQPPTPDGSIKETQ